jgi:hypothetical protein
LAQPHVSHLDEVTVFLLRTVAAFALAFLLPASAVAGKVDPLLPDATTTVVLVNVRQMVDLPPAKPHAENMLAFVLQIAPTCRQALDTLGIKPLEDIDTLTVAVENADQGTLILHGKFDPDKVHASVGRFMRKNPDQVTATRVSGVFVYEDWHSKLPIHSAVVNKETLLLSWSRDHILAAVKGGREPKLRKQVQGLIADMDDSKSVWAVFGEPRHFAEGVLKQLFNPFDLPLLIKPPLLKRVERLPSRVAAFTIVVGIGKEITVGSVIRTANKETAELLAAVLSEPRPLQLLVRAHPLLGPERGQALAEVIGDATVKEDKTWVLVSMKVTDENLRKIMTQKEP